MLTSNQKIVRIHNEVEKATLSKAQKKFNDLMNKIEVQKKLLQEWQETRSAYQQRFMSEYQPLANDYNDCRVQLVRLLDEAYHDKAFKKTDKAKLQNLISDIAITLIYEGFDELKEIYNRHNDTDFDTENENTNASIDDVMKSMMEEMFDMEFDDDADLSSPEKMREALQQKMRADLERQRHHDERQGKRKKSAKVLEKEAIQKEEEKNASKSIQEVFRKLVGVLHPDREPDAAERERKTEIMQRVNAAYAKKDLLQLLALQLEIEQINQTQLNTIAEDRLKHFNKILQEQLNELTQEITKIEYPFRAQLNMSPRSNLSPQQIFKGLASDIRNIQLTIQEVKSELKAFQNPENLKAALRNYRL